MHIVPVRCADPCAGLANPGWTTDGQRIVFTRVIGPFDGPAGGPLSRAVYRPPGRQRDAPLSQRGIDGVYEDYHARFDASGKYLIFLRLRNRDGKTAVFRMRRDGSECVSSPRGGVAADVPDLSLAADGPTRDLVVFETFGQARPRDHSRTSRRSQPPATRWRPASGEIRYVTHNGAGPRTSFNPSWSPDGQRIAFTQALFPTGPPQATSGRYGPTAATSSRSPAPRGLISGPTGAADTQQIWVAGRPGASPARPVVSGPALPGPAALSAA